MPYWKHYILCVSNYKAFCGFQNLWMEEWMNKQKNNGFLEQWKYSV